MKKVFLIISTFLFICLYSTALEYNKYKLDLDKKDYLKLNTFERAQYKKAIDLADARQYRAAASEFEKFKVQFTDSPILPYILFMKGFCLHMEKDRNNAIKVYNEVLDFFGEEIDPASKALYFLGVAYFDNGNRKKGMEAMKEMVEDKDYSKHPLAASALAALAENHWQNEEESEAVKYWKQICKDFSKTNHQAALEARTALITYYIMNKDYAGFEAWTKDSKSDSHRWTKMVFDIGNDGFRGKWNYKYTSFKQKEKVEAVKAFTDYYISQRKVFEKADDMWTYYFNLLQILSGINNDQNLMDKTINETIALVGNMKDTRVADNCYSSVVNCLRDGNKYTEAELLIARMNNQVMAEWKRLELLERQGKWNDAIKKLDVIANMNPKDSQKCAERKGNIYLNYLRKYDLAINCFREAANPPQNLWQIAECQYRQKKLNDAIGTLTEIENSFPNDASKAAWEKVEYYKGAKETKQGIAAARRIMKMFPKTGAASKAHQYLEDYGIATGGGVLQGGEDAE